MSMVVCVGKPVGEPYPPRRTFGNFDGAFSGQRAQVLFGRVCGTKTQRTRDVSTRGRVACARDMGADQCQYFALPGGKCIHE